MRVISCASRGRSRGDWDKGGHRQKLELNSDRYSNAVTSLQKDYMIAIVYESERIIPVKGQERENSKKKD